MGNIDATISSQMLEVEKMLEEALRQEEEEEGEEPARQSY
jgi:flagellar biosynthesis/type III secretory pathway protein FliH